MENWWIRFGCFLTGYKYQILADCSEASHRALKRYTAALIIICILWAFVGYSFVSRYLKGELYISVFGALLFVLIVIQVERQIILSDSKGWTKYIIRVFIGLIMAVIGSVVIDQIIFKEDIEHKKLFAINTQVDSLMPSREAELKRQIAGLDTSIAKKEIERLALMENIAKNPFVKVMSKTGSSVPVQTTTTDSNKVSVTKTRLVTTNSYVINAVQNPKMSIIPSLDKQLQDLRAVKTVKDNSLIKLRETVEKEAKANTGFLHELDLMYSILSESGLALAIWLLWFFLLLCLEIFIMVNKTTGVENDYDVCLQHQMELQKRKLNLLAKRAILPDN